MAVKGFLNTLTNKIIEKMKYPEEKRIGGLPKEDGVFLIEHRKIKNYFYMCIASTGMEWNHVSVTLKKLEKRKWKEVSRSCTWLEMCFIKSLFWEDEETSMQLHPPKSEYVSTHPYCLHLWSPQQLEIPRPHHLLVGYKADNIQS